jgi:formate dehydrogenase subunit delta
MNPANLVKMSNQIGAFFEAMPDHEQAVKDVAAHIMHTWEPRMRTALLEYTAQFGDAEFKPVVKEALLLLKKPD